MSTYLRILCYSVSIPFVLSFFPPLKFWRSLKALSISIGTIICVFGGWDVFAVWRGHWWFDPEGVYSFRLFGLPFEEILFFVVIPFCCIFTWESLNYLFKRYTMKK